MCFMRRDQSGSGVVFCVTEGIEVNGKKRFGGPGRDLRQVICRKGMKHQEDREEKVSNKGYKTK